MQNSLRTSENGLKFAIATWQSLIAIDMIDILKIPIAYKSHSMNPQYTFEVVLVKTEAKIKKTFIKRP